MDEKKKLKWQKDLDAFFPIYNSFILEGFVDDEQPYDSESGEIEYCKLYEYFDKVYSNNSTESLRKRVIIYDPTESYDKRFKICDDDCVQEEKATDSQEQNDDTEPQTVMKYTSRMSQHFWDIVYDEDIDNLLIDHKSSGVSLDFSKIHYAVTEDTGRLSPFEISEKFREFFANLVDNVQNEPSGYLFVIKMTSRLLSRDGTSNGLSEEELMVFRQLLNIVQSLNVDRDDTAARRNDNKLIILANQVRDLPTWFTDELANPYLKIINIARPSEENKLDYFHEMIEQGNFGAEFSAKYEEIDRVSKEQDPLVKRNPIEKKFLAYTNDFSMTMLRKYCEYVVSHPIEDPAKLGFSISTFRVGDMTNPWDDEDRIKDMLNIKETVGKKIKGQDEALDTAQAILTRAALGLDRAENPNAPRVVLFLAGPTGTGKTELCKQIAESIFGSEDRIVRFDMSEYGQEESDQKLFGAPPGYVGYEEGGKLTNAVKKEPFSLILFDEIEKAHNSILDKFLQILGDGRLTDGKGETVRFTDCIIVITSNAGVSKSRRPDGLPMSDEEMSVLMNGDIAPIGEMNMDTVISLENQKIDEGQVDLLGALTLEARKGIYDEVREHLRYNVKSYFHCKLGRPELYGRIEDSIVYYNYIGKDAVVKIVKSKIEDVIKSTKEVLGISEIVCPNDVIVSISNACQDAKVRALGARGIIKYTGKLFTGSLSDFLSSYIRGENGKSKSMLVGRNLTCTCRDSIQSVKDLEWSIS